MKETCQRGQVSFYPANFVLSAFINIRDKVFWRILDKINTHVYIKKIIKNYYKKRGIKMIFLKKNKVNIFLLFSFIITNIFISYFIVMFLNISYENALKYHNEYTKIKNIIMNTDWEQNEGKIETKDFFIKKENNSDKKIFNIIFKKDNSFGNFILINNNKVLRENENTEIKHINENYLDKIINNNLSELIFILIKMNIFFLINTYFYFLLLKNKNIKNIYFF